MKKSKLIISMVILSSVCFYVPAETTAKNQTDLPPLLESGSGYGTAEPADAYINTAPPAYPAFPVPPSGAAAPGVPVPPPPGTPAPGMPAPPPGTEVPGAPVPPSMGPAAVPSAVSPLSPGTAPPAGYSPVYSADITPENVRKVLSTAKELRKYLKVGRIWVLKGPGGELEVKGAVMYRGAVVSVIEFSPADGAVLPAEYRSAVYQSDVSRQAIEDQFNKIVSDMKILNGAWFRQPEACWIVPVAYNGEIIAFLRIYYDGIHVVPDYNASREMAYYGS